MSTYLHVNACNLSIFEGIPFILSQIIWWMYIKSSNFHQIPSPHSQIIKKFYDLLGQPSYNYYMQTFKSVARLWAGQFESYLAAQLTRQVSSWCGSNILQLIIFCTVYPLLAERINWDWCSKEHQTILWMLTLNIWVSTVFKTHNTWIWKIMVKGRQLYHVIINIFSRLNSANLSFSTFEPVRYINCNLQI